MKQNQGYCYQLQLDSRAEGHTTLSFLAQRFTHSTAAEWAARIRNGEIVLNGRRGTETQPLAAGMILLWNRPGWSEEDTPQSYELVFEDEYLLAVSKPSGLPTLPGGGFYLNTLLSFVRARYPSARPLHRLGRGTSGLVLFALCQAAARELTRQWPEVQKQYQALGCHVASQVEYDIRTPIGLVEHPRLGKVYAADVAGKAARSVARPLLRGDDSTIFEVDLHSGRPHQIRIHLACIGHPLVGDPMYVSEGKLIDVPGLPGDLGYRLHAKRLRFEHPVTRQAIELNSELPQALQTERP